MNIRKRTGALLLVVVSVAGCATNGEPPEPIATPVAVNCTERTAEFDRAFAEMDDGRRAIPMCPDDVGPGLDGPGVFDDFSSVTAAHVKNANRMSGTDLDLLYVMVGTLKERTAEDFVDRLKRRLGPGGYRGTARIANALISKTEPHVDRGWNVHFVDLRPAGPRGWIYGRGDRVVVAYERSQLGPPSHPLIGSEMKEAVGDVLPPNTIGTDPVPASPYGDGLDQAPIANGLSFSRDGWVYFQTGPGVARMFCGINPEGSEVTCDVPSPLYDMPEGTNRIVLDARGKRYEAVPEMTFFGGNTIAWIGERVSNGRATCLITDQAPMMCRVVGADGTYQRVNMK